MSYEQFFRDADKDGTGFLEKDEVQALMKKQGYTDQQSNDVFNRTDTTDDGKVSLDEFLAAMRDVPAQDHGAAAMRGVFEAFDTDGSGQIDKGELAAVFEEMGKHFSEEELQRMIGLADDDQSGTLGYEEFIGKVFGQ